MSDVAATPPAAPRKRSAAWLLAPLLAFAFFALLAGFVARESEPTGEGWFDLLFSDTIHGSRSC
jgi:hypothetical protein